MNNEELDKFVKDIKSGKIKNYIILGDDGEGIITNGNGNHATLFGLLHVMQMELDKDMDSTMTQNDMAKVMSKILGE